MKYRLKKDLPILKTGAIFELHDDDGYRWMSNDDTDASYQVDSIDNFDEWFEVVADEWPQEFDTVWSISSDGTLYKHDWRGYTRNIERKDIGNVFKTKEAADRFVNYSRAVTTVSRDEGFMEISGECIVATIAIRNNGLIAHRINIDDIQANSLYFDILDNAEASLDKHRNEWEIIANYDWSKE